MFTWYSESTWATSRSSFDRSSASTSTDTTNVAGWSWSHSTSMSRSAWFDQPGGVGAVGAVHRDAPAAGDEAHDLVAGHRRAAPRQADHARRRAPRRARRWRAARTARARSRRPRHGDGQLLLAAAQLLLQPLHDRLGRHVVLADGGVQRLEVGVVHRLGDVVERRRRRQLLDRQTLLAQRLGQLLAPGVDGVDPALTREPLADLGAGLRRVHELQPVAARARALDLAGEDLDGVARRQRGVERHQAPVDPRADAPVADVGVDRVGEVDRRRARGQRDDLALGREDEDLVLLEVDLQRLHELAGVGGLLLPVDHALQPEQVLGRLALLVAPVRGDAELGAPVHLLRADLHLDRPCPAGPTTVVCSDW